MIDYISQPAQYLSNPSDNIKRCLGILFVDQAYNLEIVRSNIPLIIIIAGPAYPN